MSSQPAGGRRSSPRVAAAAAPTTDRPAGADGSVSSTTDSQQSAQVSTDDVIPQSTSLPASENVVVSQSLVAPDQPHSQHVMTAEINNPNTQRILQENRNRPGPKSKKRQRDIETAMSANWRDRFNARVQPKATNRGISSSRESDQSRQEQSLERSREPETSPQPDRSYIVRPSQTSPPPAAAGNQNQPTDGGPTPKRRPPPAPTDDANGHSNVAAPRRITVPAPIGPPPNPRAAYNPRATAGKLPGG